MIKNTFLVLIASTLFLMGCGGDDETPEFTYPLNTSFKGVDKGDIEVWTKTNGTLVSVALAETMLDEDEVFTEIESEGTFTNIIFTSDTEANLIGDGDLVLNDTTTVTYTYANNSISFPLTYNNVTFNYKAVGNPEAFDLESQAYVEDDGSGFTISLSGALRQDIEMLKEGLEEGSTIAIMNYTEKYEQ